MAEQLWKGRFSKAVDSRVNDFNSSIRFDQRMIAQDMRGSGVHAAMLAKQGIISEKDCEDILNGLASIADDLAAGRLEIDPGAEDVHTFVEQTLTARIGDAGKRLHTGRSRNDQVALDIRLTLRDYSHTLQAYIVELIKVICRKAAENTTAVMPGYTHLQRAQPITFGHALMAYASMLLRDLQRFEDATARMDAQCPLGSGALAGTTYPLDRQFTAEKLGFAAPCANSLDGVSDRDFCIELAMQGDETIARRLEHHPKIRLEYNCALREILGTDNVEALVIENTTTGQQVTVSAQGVGVFIFVGYRPATAPFAGALPMDENGYLLTDDRLETPLPGIFAAGDVRQKPLRQIVTAVSDGAIAAVHACKYCSGML